MKKTVLMKVLAGVLSVGITAAGAVGLNMSSTADVSADNEPVAEASADTETEDSVPMDDDKQGERTEKENTPDVQSDEDKQFLLEIGRASCRERV